MHSIQTFVIGPEVGNCPSLIGVFDLKAVIAWLTPSAKINCSRNSMLVRPLAKHAHKQKINHA